jgi:DnaK suppressor protein
VVHLDETQRATLRRMLVDERARLLEHVAAETEQAAPDEEVGDIEDDAAAEARQQQARLRQRHHTDHIREIDAALARMEDGSYGICEETGEPIPFARLQLEPTARYTVEALEMLEQERARERVIASDERSDGY